MEITDKIIPSQDNPLSSFSRLGPRREMMLNIIPTGPDKKPTKGLSRPYVISTTPIIVLMRPRDAKSTKWFFINNSQIKIYVPVQFDPPPPCPWTPNTPIID